MWAIFFGPEEMNDTYEKTTYTGMMDRGVTVYMFESLCHVLVKVTLKWGVCIGVHMHFTCQHHVNDLILRWKSVTQSVFECENSRSSQ